MISGEISGMEKPDPDPAILTIVTEAHGLISVILHSGNIKKELMKVELQLL